MKAALWIQRRNMEISELTPEELKSDEVRVRVAWCGICATDLHEFLHGPLFLPELPHPLTSTHIPLVPGHEISGTIVEKGEEVTNVTEGDNVAVFPIISCGDCEYCRSDRERLCEKMAFIGFSANGGFSEFATIPAKNVYKVEGVSLEHLVFAEPIAAAIHAVKRAKITPETTVAIIGAGPIGLLTAFIAKLRRANVIITEVLEGRRELAGSLGFDVVLDPLKNGFLRKVRSLTGGKGVEVSIDCAGSFNTMGLDMKNPIYEALSITKIGGRVTIVGVHDFPSTVDLRKLLASEKELAGSWLFSREDFEEGLDIIKDGKIPLDSFITDRIYLEDLVSRGFLELEIRKDEHIKILVTPRKELIGSRTFES